MMHRHLRPILAMIAAGILLAVYRWDVTTTERAILANLQSQQLLFENPAHALAIEFHNSTGMVRVERPGGAGSPWRITAPRDLPAHDPAINAYLENLRGAKRHAVFVPEDLARYGLADPELRVVLTVRDESGTPRQRTIEFGSQPDAQGKVYGRVTDEPYVFTVSDWIVRQSRMELAHLRSRQVAGETLTRAQRLRVRTQRETFTIQRPDVTATQWQLHTPEAALPADSVLVDRVIANLTQGSLIQVLDNPTSTTVQLGLEPPLATVEVDDATLLSIGNRIPGRDQLIVQTADGTVGIAPASLFADIFRPSPEWGTKRMIWLPPARIAELETSSGNMRMMLLREPPPKGWIFATMPGVPVRQDLAAEFVENVSAFTATRLVRARLPEEEYRDYGIIDESYTLVATGEDGSVQGLLFGRTDTREGFSYVVRMQDSSLWQVDVRAQNRVYRFARDLEERRMVPGLFERVGYFEIEVRGSTITFEKTPSAWRATLPGQRPAIVRPDRINGFLQAFEAMEVDAELLRTSEHPPQATFRFMAKPGDFPFATAGLIMRSATTRKALFLVDNRQYEVAPEQFDPVDDLMAEMLLGTRAEMEE